MTWSIVCGIVRTPFPHTMLHVIYTAQEPMVAVMTRENLCGADPCRIALPELKNIPLILYRRFDRLIQEAFSQADVEPVVLCRNDDARTTLQWAHAGLGVGLVPKSVFSLSGLDRLTAKEIDCPELVTRMAVIWRKNRYISAPACKFIEYFS